MQNAMHIDVYLKQVSILDAAQPVYFDCNLSLLMRRT